MLVYMDIHSLKPYDHNARINTDAIPFVAKSMKQFGFISPIILDKHHNILAGHTRLEAAKLNGYSEVPCFVFKHLTPEQADAFRLADNKTAEASRWDYDLLADEVSRLSAIAGVDFTDFGWSQEQLDCLTDAVADDCMSAAEYDDDDQSRARQRAVDNQRAPTRTRFVIGEFVIFVPTDRYKQWANSVRTGGEYDEDAINAELLDRLGVAPYLEA